MTQPKLVIWGVFKIDTYFKECGQDLRKTIKDKSEFEK
jgi:hypothetical protein